MGLNLSLLWEMAHQWNGTMTDLFSYLFIYYCLVLISFLILCEISVSSNLAIKYLYHKENLAIKDDLCMGILRGMVLLSIKHDTGHFSHLVVWISCNDEFVNTFGGQVQKVFQ